MSENSRMQWSMKFGEDIFVLRAKDGETQDEFLENVASFRASINAKFPPAAADPKYVAPVQGGVKQIPVESIQLASGGEHPRWVVKGGNLKKFGVTCWPEVLEAAGILSKLDPMKENKPSGSWIAKYVEKAGDDGNMKPDKVVELVRA